MTLTTSDIPHLWANQSRDHARVSGVSFNGGVLFSYSTPIAAFARNAKQERFSIAAPVTWETNGHVNDAGQWAYDTETEIRTLPVVLINRNSYSVTTSRHQSRMWGALGYGRERIAHTFTVDAPTPGHNGKVSAPHDYKAFHAHNLADYAARIMAADAAAQKARKPEKAAQYATEAARLIDEAQRYAKAFKVRWAWKGADAERKRIEREAKKAAKLEAARRAEYAARERARLIVDREADADKFAEWQAGGLFGCPYSYRADDSGSVYMRRFNGADGVDELQTSQGVSVPWAHAVRVFQYIRQVRETGQPFKANGRTIRVGHFHVDSIDEQGNMRAGCHYFTWERIAEVAEREGVFDVAPSAEAVETREHA